MKLLRSAVLLLAAALLAGCSATRFIYNNADVFLRWQSGRYLDVHGAQSEELDARVAALLAWHRTEALPRYVAFARDADARLGRGFSRADLVWGYDSFQREVRAAMRAAADQAAPLLDRLSAEQIDHVQQRFTEDNRKFAREQLEGDERERRRKRARRNIERLEDWLGSLTDAQAERVRQYSARAPLVAELRDRERRRLQAEFIAILRAREAVKRLAAWAEHWDRHREHAFVAAHQANLEALYDMLIDVDRSLSAEQRETARERMRGFAADFERLARK